MKQTKPLDAATISSYMIRSLPRDGRIKSQTEAVALAAHACMLSVGFRLVGLGEDHRIEIQDEGDDVARLPPEWNDSSTYAFRYKHEQSSMEYLLKVNRLGSKAVIMGVGLGDDKTASCEVLLDSYIDKAETPFGPLPDEPDAAQTSIPRIFVSDHHLSDFARKMDTEIIRKLMPGIRKEGYEEVPPETATSSTRDTQGQRTPIPGRAPNIPRYDPLRDDPLRDDPLRDDPLRDDPLNPRPARPHPFDDPLDDPLRSPRRPIADFAPPGFEDEYEMNRPPRRMPGMGMPGMGLPAPNLGERDLYPQGLGPNDPMRVGGNFPRPGFGGPGGGMHPTFDDPLFQGQGEEGGFDMQAPPGARFDPVGPGMGAPRDGRLGRGGGGFLRGGPRGFGGGGPPNPFSGFGSGDFV